MQAEVEAMEYSAPSERATASGASTSRSAVEAMMWESAAAEGARTFRLEDKLWNERFSKPESLVKTMSGRDLTVSWLQREGFNNPLLVEDKAELDLRVPAWSAKRDDGPGPGGARPFGVADVRSAVGSRRIVDVVDCSLQKSTSMTMKEWHRYFDGSDRASILNVTTLEFSSTRLDTQVTPPRIVRQIDWIDKAWPRHLKDLQLEATNSFEDMMYPKVQKYCIMSVEKCYTDFHIDFGGSSAWYHPIQGKKVFFLIPPTDENLKRYEEWVLTGKQSDVFFGDLVDQCARIEISAGQTLFIPSGWIHAVYTSQDAIVFGGNFLHSFAMEKQLQVARIEESTHVPTKFRFPFFTEMLWYVLDRYVHCLTGRTHLDLPEEEKRRIRLERGDNVDPLEQVLKINMGGGIVVPKEHVHLTQAELNGIKFVIMYLYHLPASKKNVPVMLPDPIAVVKDVRGLVLDHKDDCPDQAVSGKYILRWSENDDTGRKRGRPLGSTSANSASGGSKGGGDSARKSETASRMMHKKLAAGNRRRRVRCKKCEACLGGDCRACVYCKDMIKYGGPGRMKQTCEKRRCIHPQLPVCAYCSICHLDGWNQEPKVQVKEVERPEDPPNLFECTVCLDIVHPHCAEKNFGLGKINNDLSNSWECAKCNNSGYSNVPSRSQFGKRKSGTEEETEEAVKRIKE